jgi:DNA-binding NtrC family response regulator
MAQIALVDDKNDALAIVELLLKKAGFDDTRCYEDAESLLRDMEQGIVPDCVVTDFCMPGKNGAELLDEIADRFGAIPGIIITGYPEGATPALRKLDAYPILCKGTLSFFPELIGLIRKIVNEREIRYAELLARRS